MVEIPDQELEELIIKAQAGDHTAAQLVVMQFLPLVKNVSRKFPSELQEDNEQNGVLGLYRALETYDKGSSRFGTYAYYWVYNAISRGSLARNNSVMTDLDVNTLAASTDIEARVTEEDLIEKAFERLAAKHSPVFTKVLHMRMKEGRTLRSIAAEIGVTRQRVEQMMKIVNRFIVKNSKGKPWNTRQH